MNKDNKISWESIRDRMKENREPGQGSNDQQGQQSEPGKLSQLAGKVKSAADEGLKTIFAHLPPIKQSAFEWPNVEKAPEFPSVAGGRLPASIRAIMRNRDSNEVNRREKEQILKARQSNKQCLKKLKISLFFDGTDSHEKADSAVTGQTPPTEDEIRQYSKQAQQAALIKE
ncbi:hypothetical protein PT286_06550 [Neisseriaceae bacterium ESL0693]|nr:hypothetical protein [Neisseriaceae bacterium ESL0693]